jgi:alpha-tubulin suppressor-like RCC1 family protein
MAMIASRDRGRAPAALLALLLALLLGAALAPAASAATLAAGSDVGCAVRDDGQLLCWGAADVLPSVDHPHGSAKAIPATGVGDAVDVATSARHGCAVRRAGTVACWGDDSEGQLGDGGDEQQFVPVPVDGVADAVAVTAGDAHSCALLRDATVRCWGSDAAGQSGGAWPAGVVSLDAGAQSTCAALATGAVSCRGLPANLALAPPISDAAAVAAGDEHACALRRGGTVICWGANDHGQLGLGTESPPTGHRDVPGLRGVTAIAAGGATTCALRGDGTVACWGGGASGQLGDGGLTGRPTPVTVTGLSDATAVTVGDAGACALRADGVALCWGANGAGQLGNDRTPSATAPVPVPLARGAFSVATGTGDHRCATFASDGVRCWGANDRGQLGDGTRELRIVPTAVSGLAYADGITVGERHSCALVEVRVECWGAGGNGRLGNGTAGDRATPVPVPGIQATQVSAGDKSTCAVTVQARVSCWGARWFRAVLPDPARWEDLATPVPVGGTDQAVQVVVLDNAACALLVDMTVKCWGQSNDGQLGVGWSSIDFGSTDAIPVIHQDGTPLAGVVELRRAGTSSICAQLADESFVCWGERYGIYARAFATDAFPLPPGEHCVLSADGTSCIGSGCVLDAGAVSCVGDGTAGQLGDGLQPAGHYPLQPLAAPVVGIGGGVRQPAERRQVTAVPPPVDPLPPAVIAPAPRAAPPTPRTARKPFAIKGAKAGRNGRIALTLAVPAAGGVRIAASATVAGRRVTWFKTAKAIVVRSGARSVAIVASAAARKALARAGKAKVTLRVTFTPKGAKPVVRTTTVTVRR